MAENRNMAIDMAKGIGILLVVIGHTAGMKHIGQELIYSFHMPLFFIIAGYFYRPSATLDLMKNSLKRLIVPWAITLGISILICLLMKDYDEAYGFAQGIIFPDGTRDDIMILPGMHSSGAIWFLPALFWCRIVYNWIYRISTQYALIISFFVTCFSVVVGRYIFNTPCAFGIGCSATVFYAAGHIMSRHHFLDKNVPLWTIVPLFIMWVLYERYVDFEMFAYNYDITYLQDVMIAIAVSYAMLNACERITNCVKSPQGGGIRSIAMARIKFFIDSMRSYDRFVVDTIGFECMECIGVDSYKRKSDQFNRIGSNF